MRTSSVIFLLGAFYLWSLVLQAPLRYELERLNLNFVIYLPKLLLLAAIVFLPLFRQRFSKPALVITSLVGLYLVWGLVNLRSPAQSLFGLWILVPLLFGLWMGADVKFKQWRRLFLVLFIISAAGIFLNPFIQYPWSGQSLRLLGKHIEMSRDWSYLGLHRYAGFSSVSYNAAAQLLLFGVMLVVLFDSTVTRLVVWLVAGAGIVLTTSKGPLGSWLLLSLYFYGGAILHWPKYWAQIWIGVLTFIMLAMILIPVSTLLISYHPNLQDPSLKFLFASFGERLNWTWPVSLHLLDLHGYWHWFVGRGLGGIGSSQKYFEPKNNLPADNLFIYVSVWFGLPLALCLFTSIWYKFKYISYRGKKNWYIPVVLVIISNGVVSNQLEVSTMALFLGLSLGCVKNIRLLSKKTY